MQITDKNGTLKNSAKNLLAGKYHTVVMTLLFYLMVTLLLTRFSSSLTDQICMTLLQQHIISETSPAMYVLSYGIPLLISIVENMLQLGICLFFLNIACHQNYNTFDLLYGYSNQFGKTFCLSGILTLLSFVAFLPTNFLLYLYKTKSLQQDAEIILLLIQAGIAIIYLMLSLSLSQIYYINLDHPELSIQEILQQSFKLMKGNKMRLFLLDISFLPLLLLALPTLGISLFWVTPYLNMTHALFFLDLMNADISQDTYQQAGF